MPTTLLREQTATSDAVRREAVLAHVQRYKITLVYVVKRLFFPSYVEPDHQRGLEKARSLLNSLVAEGRLARLTGRSEFAKNVYMTPSHNIKEDSDLSRLWFCCMRRERRYLAVYDEVRPLFEAENLKPAYHNFAHCVADLEGGPVLLRLYLCLAEKKSAREMLVQSVSQKAKSFRHWVDTGSYGVAVLVQSEQKKKEIEKLLTTSYGGKAPLREQARFIVETVPTIQTFPQFIKQHINECWR